MSPQLVKNQKWSSPTVGDVSATMINRNKSMIAGARGGGADKRSRSGDRGVCDATSSEAGTFVMSYENGAFAATLASTVQLKRARR